MAGENARISIGQKSINVVTRRTQYISLLKPSFVACFEFASENPAKLIAMRKSHESAVRKLITIIGSTRDNSIHVMSHQPKRRLTFMGPNKGTRTPIIVLTNKSISAKWKRILIVISPKVHRNQPQS